VSKYLLKRGKGEWSVIRALQWVSLRAHNVPQEESTEEIEKVCVNGIYDFCKVPTILLCCLLLQCVVVFRSAFLSNASACDPSGARLFSHVYFYDVQLLALHRYWSWNSSRILVILMGKK